MSIIIRLQNLPLEANSLDIRRFFQGLSIPDGGVHIVGGEHGDAFIAFGSDEDARQAMERSGDTIKESRIKLLLSSRNEMQRVIEQARTQSLGLKQVEPAPVANSYMVPNLMASVGQMNNLKPAESQQLGGRSPDRRQRVMDQERLTRNRSRSRSPFRKDLNGASVAMIDKILSSGMINPMNVREGALLGVDNFNQAAAPVRTRLGYSEIVPANHLPEQIARNNNQWQLRSEPLNTRPPEVAHLDARNNRLVLGPGEYNSGNDKLVPSGPTVFATNARGLNSERTYTVELRNLPFNITPRDLMEFFNGLYVLEENIKILIDDRGLTTGGALVRFTSERDFDLALSMNGKFMFGRRIDIQPLLEPIQVAERNDLLLRQPTLQSNSLAINQPIVPVNSGQRDYVLYMKGLPFTQCTERDVAAFFEGIRLVDIAFEMDHRDKPSGNAYVEFEGIRDYNAAMQLNMKHMGRRYIELLPATKENLLEARRGSYPNRTVLNDLPKTTFCINITNLPPTINNRDLTNYFIDCGAQPFAIHIMLKQNGLNAGEAFVEFSTSEHQYAALRRDGDVLGSNRIKIKPVSFEEMRMIVGNPPNRPLDDHPQPPVRNQVSHGRHRNARNDQRDRARERRERQEKRRGDNSFPDPRCMVIASNIPYRASMEDIAVFFSDFGITENCIQRRFNEKGQPTAEAKIIFRTPEDASRAVRQMNKKFLIGRSVSLRHA